MHKGKHYERKIALGRVGNPDDCAGVCVFLYSEASRYMVAKHSTWMPTGIENTQPFSQTRPEDQGPKENTGTRSGHRPAS